MKKIIITSLAIFCFKVVYSHEGVSEIILASDAQDRFIDVIECLEGQSASAASKANSLPHLLTLEVGVGPNHVVVKSVKQQGALRNYNSPVIEEERNDLAYITTTLARSSLPSLAILKPKLKKAGERIDHLHPLRFLMIIFTDEELKANISAIRSRGSWVWDKFYEGLEGSLRDESRKNNMNNEYVADFANTIGINLSLIQGLVQDKKWKEFVNILIDTVPRSGNTTRYDM